MSSKQFEPLTLGLVEQGDLLDESNRAFQDMHRQLCRFVEHYGERAKGAAAEMTITIKLKCESVDDRVFGVEGTYKTKMPSRPARNTKAIQVTEDDGTTMLMVRSSGSTPGDPNQLHLPIAEASPVTGTEVHRDDNPQAPGF